jgi:mono/diheme cytochrome c family protein
VPVDAGPIGFFDDAGTAVTFVDAAAPSADLDSTVPGEAAVAEAGLQGVAPPRATCLGDADGGSSPRGDTPFAFFSHAFMSPSGPTQGSPPLPPGCLPSGIVLGVLTALGADGSVVLNVPFPAVLPLDTAVSPDGSAVAAVAPGNALTSGLDTVFVFSACGLQQESTSILAGDGTSEQPIAVAFAGGAQLLVQTREPAELRIYGAAAPITIALSSVSRRDTGQDVFHTQAGGMIACASCHPEGGDDGHVWILDGKRRRTPSLQGTIAGTAPYHWPGDEADLNVLVKDVYTVRMSGALLPDDQRNALTGWVQAVPPPAAPAWSNSRAAQRGQALFERTDVGCRTCHSGAKFTNNKTVDVGTGGAFQVPPLVGVGWRTPLMHDGCAATIADRFGACSTAGHGSTASLSAGEISDLVSYLETL